MTITTHREGVPATARSRWIMGWGQHGACSKAEPDALFIPGRAQQAAKKVCARCPVVPECLADSLDIRRSSGSGAV